MTLETVRFLETHSLNELNSRYNIIVKRTEAYPYKAVLNYHQIETPRNVELCKECRGLILSTHDGSRIDFDKPFKAMVMAYPFKRFFNWDEGSKDEVDFSNAVVVEKLDGTLCSLYFDIFLGEWCVSTRKTLDAKVPLENDSKYKNFSELFWKGLETQGIYNFDIKSLDKNMTYIFEVTSPFNEIVVEYNEIKSHLIGIRDNTSLVEYKAEEPLYNGSSYIKLARTAPRVISVQNTAPKRLIELLDDTSPKEIEGFVVRDNNFNRVKVKSIPYQYAHGINSLLDTKEKLYGSIVEDRIKELKVFLTDARYKYLTEMNERFNLLTEEIEEQTNTILEQTSGTTDPRKYIGLALKDKGLPGYVKGYAFSKLDNPSLSFKEFASQKKNNKFNHRTRNEILAQIRE